MTTMARSGYQLVAGSTELMENDWGPFRIDTLGANATFGDSAPVTEVMSSLMVDGDLTSTTRFGNRVAAFDVTVTAADAGMLATGEAALMAELDKVNTLTWHVPFGAPTVFEVVRSWSEFVMDDLTEVQQCQRTFRLYFECLPHGCSVDPVTISWAGGSTEVSTASTTGWTVVGAGAIAVSGGHIQKTTTASDLTLSRSVLMDEYVWLKVEGALSGGDIVVNVSVDGVSIPSAQIRREPLSGHHFYTIPTHAWVGTTATIQFTIGAYGGGSNRAILEEFWTRSYPSPVIDVSDTRPKGIGVLDVVGSARTPCTISFTAPAGGAFVYTAPDPNVALRDKGAGESVYAKFTVTGTSGAEVTVGGQLMWFPPGDHTTSIGTTASQPLELHPNGVWPTEPTGAADFGVDVAAGATQWSYPMDAKAAISFFTTSGAKTLISPSPSLPQGYHGDAVTHEQHTLHPGRSGFAVLDVNGDPITTTITYYPRWKHHAAQ